MGMRPGQAKGPYVGTDSGGGGPPGPPGPPGSALWLTFTVTHTQFQVAGLQQNIQVYSLPATYVIHSAIVYPTVAFAGTGILTYDLSLGIIGNLESLIPDYDVTGVPAGNMFNIVNVVQAYNLASTTSIRVNAKAVGANLSNSTAGTAKVYIFVTNLNNL